MTADRRTAPLERARRPVAAAASTRVALRELPFLAQVELRVAHRRADAAAADGARLPLPLDAEHGGRRRRRPHALWLGPDEWLVVGAARERGGARGRSWPARGAATGSVVDLSANRTALEVAAPRARDVLAKGCALDLHPRAFGPGRCAQTLLGRAQVILWQASDGRLRHLRPPLVRDLPRRLAGGRDRALRGRRRCGCRAAGRGPRGATARRVGARSARGRRRSGRAIDALAMGHARDVLLDDRARVELLGDVVRSGADDLHAALVRLRVRVGAGEGGQERVVDVDDLRPHRLEEGRAEDLHVARQHDQVARTAEQAEQRALGLRLRVTVDRHM